MKLSNQFIMHRMKESTVLIPAGGTEFAGVVKGNATMETILSLLTEDTSREQVIAKMLERFDAPSEVITADVDRALSALQRIGALEYE